MTTPEDRAKDLARRPALNKERSGNVMYSGIEGKRPSITDIHEAIMEGHIDSEQGSDLNAKYQPDAYKVNKSGERASYNPWLQNQHVYNNMVKARKKRSAPKEDGK